MLINKKHKRRYFIKTLLSLGFFSIFPFKIKGEDQIDACNITTSDIEGPYYIPNSPNVSVLTPPEIISDFLFVTGTVYANDCTTPIPNAIVDVWHSNRGEYDETTSSYLNSAYEDTFYRGKIYTDNNGNYAYQTVLPGKYLNGNYYRPSHIHYKSSYMGQNEITTQLYFEGDSSINKDPWASNSAAEDRIIPLAIDKNNNSHGVFDIILNTIPSDITPISLKETKIINAIYPNPITQETYIYLNQKNTQTLIEICDINGKIMTKHRTTLNKIRLFNILTQDLKKGIYILKATQNNTKIEAKRFCL